MAVNVRFLLVLALAAAQGCSENTPTGLDAGESNLDANAGLDADIPDADIPSCGEETAVTEYEVLGLTSPVFYADREEDELPDDPDPDRFSVTYNGEKVRVFENGSRNYRIYLCAGPAVLDIKHEMSGVSVGHWEWEVPPERFTVPGAVAGGWPEDSFFRQTYIIVYGMTTAFTVDPVEINYAEPTDGKWRVYVFNGYQDDSISARIAGLDMVNQTVIPDEENPFIAPVVTGLAAKSSAVVEADHPYWHDTNEEPVYVTFEFWFDSAPTVRRSFLIQEPVLPTMTETGLANWPDGSILFFYVWPDHEATLEGHFFNCRDPMFRQMVPGGCE
jgi:hypothetical protein